MLPPSEIDLPKGRYLTSPMWIEKIGGTMSCSKIGAAEAVERGVWYRTHVKRDGSRLTATTYLCAAGNPQVFSVTVDLARIAKKLAQYHRALHGQTTVGRASSPAMPRALRQRLMSCRADCETNLFAGVDDDTLDEIVGKCFPTFGRSTVPNYSRALRRRLMACRADCETNLIGIEEIVDPDEVTEEMLVEGTNWKAVAKRYRNELASVRRYANRTDAKLQAELDACRDRSRMLRAHIGANTGFDTEAAELFAGFFDDVTKPFKKAVEKIGRAKLVQGVTKGIGEAVKVVAEPQKALDMMAKAGNLKIGPIPVGAFYGPWLADQAARRALGNKLYNAGAKVAVNAALTAVPPLKAANLAAKLIQAKDPAAAAAVIPALKAQPIPASATGLVTPPKVSPEGALAFNAARTALVSIEKDNAIRANLKGVAKTLATLPRLKAEVAKVAPPQRPAMLQRNPALKNAIFAALKAKAAVQIMKATGGVAKVKAIQARGQKARVMLQKIADRARAGNPDAQKLAKVITIVNGARERTKNVAAAARGGYSGAVIDESGKITRGRFTRGSGTSSLFFSPGGKKTRGNFTRVGCDCEQA
jgi:hypothetical protein